MTIHVDPNSKKTEEPKKEAPKTWKERLLGYGHSAVSAARDVANNVAENQARMAQEQSRPSKSRKGSKKGRKSRGGISTPTNGESNSFTSYAGAPELPDFDSFKMPDMPDFSSFDTWGETRKRRR